jgi:hypothetical protein
MTPIAAVRSEARERYTERGGGPLAGGNRTRVVGLHPGGRESGTIGAALFSAALAGKTRRHGTGEAKDSVAGKGEAERARCALPEPIGTG